MVDDYVDLINLGLAERNPLSLKYTYKAAIVQVLRSELGSKIPAVFNCEQCESIFSMSLGNGNT